MNNNTKDNYPKNVVQCKEVGNSFFAKQDFKAAVIYYTRGIAMDPSNSVLLSNRAECYLRLGIYQLALADASQAIQEDSSNIKSYARAFKSLVGLGNFSLARLFFVKMSYQISKSGNPHDYYSELKQFQGMIIPKEPFNPNFIILDEDECTKKGHKAKEESKYEEAYDWYTKAIREHPKNIVVRLYRGEVQLHRINSAHLALWDCLSALRSTIPLAIEARFWRLKAQALCILKDFGQYTKSTIQVARILNPDDLSLAKLQTASLSWKPQPKIDSALLDMATVFVIPERKLYTNEEEAAYLPKLFLDNPFFEVKRIPGMGRGVFAKVDIKPNTKLILPSVVAATLREDMCQDCFTELEGKDDGIVCQLCGIERYCSKKCLQHSWDTYHKALCGKRLDELRESVRLHAQSSSGKTGLLIARIMGMIMCSPEFSKASEYTGVPCINKMKFLMNSRENLELFWDSVAAPYTRFDYVFDVQNNPHFNFDWYTTMLAMISLNSFSVLTDSAQFPRTCGSTSVIFEEFSFFNHSCVPNIEITVEACKGKIKTMKEIKKGEQCFISYNDTNASKKERDMHLIPYGIKCKCAKCILGV